MVSAPELKPPSGDSAARAAAKESVWRLSALAFGHPTAEMQDALKSGGFHRAFDQSWSAVTGRHWPEVTPSPDLATLEAGYITAFLHGPKGKPIASLFAGDHDHLLAGQARPVFMLNISAFYRHFGLKAAAGDEGRADEPDHLASMLEFMAVLCHLEVKALGENRDPSPFRRAERDFIRRHVGPMLRTVAGRLRTGPATGLDPVVTQLIEEQPSWAESQAAELEARVGPYRDPDQPGFAETKTKQVAAGDLWG